MKRVILMLLMASTMMAGTVQAAGSKLVPAKNSGNKWVGVSDKDKIDITRTGNDFTYTEKSPGCQQLFPGNQKMICSGVVLDAHPETGQLLVDTGFKVNKDGDMLKLDQLVPWPIIFETSSKTVFIDSKEVKDFRRGDWVLALMHNAGKDVPYASLRPFPEHSSGKVQYSTAWYVVRNPKNKSIKTRKNNDGWKVTASPELFFFPSSRELFYAPSGVTVTSNLGFITNLSYNMGCVGQICTYSLSPESELVYNDGKLMSVKLPLSMQSEISMMSAKFGRKITANSITGWFIWILENYDFHRSDKGEGRAMLLLNEITQRLNEGDTDPIMELITRYNNR